MYKTFCRGPIRFETVSTTYLDFPCGSRDPSSSTVVDGPDWTLRDPSLKDVRGVHGRRGERSEGSEVPYQTTPIQTGSLPVA